MKIAILGAGGIGGYFGGALARAGHEVTLLSRGENLSALRERGIEVKTPDETYRASVNATDDPERIGAVDVAIVSVKTYSLGEIAPAAKLLAEGGATILPLLNGVEAVARLAAAGVPARRLVGGLAEISAARVAPGVVERRSPFQRVAVGETRGGSSERVETIASAFRESGVEARVSEDITLDLWRKLAFIAPMAAGCGLARSPIGPIRQARLGRLLFERAAKEVLAVARARGVAVEDADATKILGFIDALPAQLEPSFLLDLKAGRPTELDDLCGAVSRFGQGVNVETPVHDVATAALGVAALPPHSAR